MEIIRSYKVKLYPNKTQEEQLDKITNGCRFVWNYFLEQRKEYYLQNKKTLSYAEMAREVTKLRKELPELQGIQLEPLQQALRRLDTAYNRFFRKTSNFPRFKSRLDNRQSFQKHQDWKVVGNRIQVQGDLKIKFRGDVDISSKLGTLIIVKTENGWFASITAKVVVKKAAKLSDSVGIDMGVEALATLSTGKKYKNIRPQQSLQSKLGKTQKELARKTKGSNRRAVAKKRVGRIYNKIKNVRQDHLHKTTRAIVSLNPSLIAVEDLNVQGMVKNRKLARVLSDASMGEFLRQLEYKQKANGGEFVKIDRFFPSSKTCNRCRFVVDSLPLSVREWECPSCGEKHDRDVNAAKVILTQAYGVRGDLERVSARRESPKSLKRKLAKA